MVKLLIQPQDGIAPLLSAIKKAKTSIDLVIFRFDRAEIEAALMAAVGRGVAVSALIAYANRGGEKQLRKLEMRLLDAGVKVSRTPAKLVRYHNKMMIVDRRLLFVLSFNFTHMDIDHSRGFGIVTRKPKLVQEAMKLFAADSQRKTYKAGLDTFIVSPVNARKQLGAFIQKAKKELLIYDPNISDTNMAKALVARAAAGVKIRVIGAMSRKNAHIDVRPPDWPPAAHAHDHLRPAGSIRGQPEPARPRARRTTRVGCHRPRGQDGEEAAGHLRGGLVGQRTVRESRGHGQGLEESCEVRGGGADPPESDCQTGCHRCGGEDWQRGSGSEGSAGERSEGGEGGGSRARTGNHERSGRRILISRLATAAVAIGLTACLGAAPPAHVSQPTVVRASTLNVLNFGRVNDWYYRGSQPLDSDYARLKAFGIRTVIDLRADGLPMEASRVKAAGMRFERIPMTTRVVPTAGQIALFLALVNDPANQPVYVHCEGGRHRTGVMTAIYRMTQDRWTGEQAFNEMKQYQYGADYLHPEFKRFVYAYPPRTSESCRLRALATPSDQQCDAAGHGHDSRYRRKRKRPLSIGRRLDGAEVDDRLTTRVVDASIHKGREAEHDQNDAGDGDRFHRLDFAFIAAAGQGRRSTSRRAGVAQGD